MGIAIITKFEASIHKKDDHYTPAIIDFWCFGCGQHYYNYELDLILHSIGGLEKCKIQCMNCGKFLSPG